MKADYPITRKTDFVNWNGVDPYRHGGVVTLVLEMDNNRRRIKIGFSFCSPGDRFTKRVGHEYAQARLNACPIEVPVLYNAEAAVGDVLKALCMRDWENLEQVTTLEIYTAAWRKAVPGWAKKWWMENILAQPQSPFDKLGEALAEWADEITAVATVRSGSNVAPCLAMIHQGIQELRIMTNQMFSMADAASQGCALHREPEKERKH